MADPPGSTTASHQLGNRLWKQEDGNGRWLETPLMVSLIWSQRRYDRA